MSPPERDEPEELEDLSDLAEKAEDSGVVEISQITELEWDDEEAATRIDPRLLAPSLGAAPPADTVMSPPPAVAPPKAGPPVPRSRAPTLLGVQAAAPTTPGQISLASTIPQSSAPPLPGGTSGPAPSQPISPFLQVADPVPVFAPTAAAPAFPETGFEEGIPPDYEAAAQARLAASPVFQAPAPTIDFADVGGAQDDFAMAAPRSKAWIGLVIGAAVAVAIAGVVIYALVFSTRPGAVVVRTTVPGATVTVDGVPLAGNPGFVVASDLSPGPHTFTLTAPGMGPVTQTIVVEEDRTIDAPLDLGATALAMAGGTTGPGLPGGTGFPGMTSAGPMPGTAFGATVDPSVPATSSPLAATTAPATAAPATAAPEAATAAPAKVTKRAPRAPRQPRQPRQPAVTKQPAGGGGGDGFLTVQTTPWSTVSVDGRPIGNTPIRRHSLRAGSHTVSMVNSELGVRHSQRVTIAAGAEVRVIRTLQH